jgi:hypothetical protein
MPWTDDERKRCYELAGAGMSRNDIAYELSKPRAVISRLLNMPDYEAVWAEVFSEKEEAQEEAVAPVSQCFVSNEQTIEWMRIFMDNPHGSFRLASIYALEEDMKLLQSLYNFAFSILCPKSIVADEPPQPNGG